MSSAPACGIFLSSFRSFRTGFQPIRIQCHTSLNLEFQLQAANDASVAGSSLTFIHPGFRLSNAL